jgi:hypothetical protein
VVIAAALPNEEVIRVPPPVSVASPHNEEERLLLAAPVSSFGNIPISYHTFSCPFGQLSPLEIKYLFQDWGANFHPNVRAGITADLISEDFIPVHSNSIFLRFESFLSELVPTLFGQAASSGFIPQHENS